MSRGNSPDLDRIRQLAAELARADSGPASQLVRALADEVASVADRVGEMADRVESLWQLIAAVVDAAGLEVPDTGAPREFVQALHSAQSAGNPGMRLTIGGREWVAAISPDQPPADPGHAWAALERLARMTDEQASQPDGT